MRAAANLGRFTTATLRFQVDSHSRRTHTWLGSNADHTTWVAHYQLDYTKSDKVNRIRAYQGTGDTNNTLVIDTTYCYKIQDQTVGGVTVQGVDIGDSCTAADGVTSVGKLQWKKDNISGQTIDYVYTKSGRLSDAHVSDGADYNYQYTKNGSRKYNDGTNLTFNDENQLTTTGYTYDGAGNLTTSPALSAIGYTSADQLKTVTKAGIAYTYKHAGSDQKELLSETTPIGTYKLDYGRNNNKGIPVIEQASKDANTASVINDPVTGQPLMLRTSSGMQSMYVYDGTPGNPIALITSAAYKAFAYSYDPYGVPTLTEDSGGLGVGQNPYTFAGGIQDRTTGWVHFGNRYYDPKTGTWTQMDTLDTPLSPGNANRYAYAAGDPINNIDPIGNISCGFAVVLLGASVYGVAQGTLALVAAEAAAAPETAGTTAGLIGPTITLGVSAIGFLGSQVGVAESC